MRRRRWLRLAACAELGATPWAGEASLATQAGGKSEVRVEQSDAEEGPASLRARNVSGMHCAVVYHGGEIVVSPAETPRRSGCGGPAAAWSAPAVAHDTGGERHCHNCEPAPFRWVGTQTGSPMMHGCSAGRRDS